MIERMKPLHETLKVGTLFVNASLKEIEDDDFCRRTGENSNSLQWILGHLIASRHFMMRMLGHDFPTYADNLFDRGAEPVDKSNYPNKSKMLEDWNDISSKLLQAVENVSEDTLASEGSPLFPNDDKTTFGNFTFICFHENYHVGQIAYIQKILGYKTLAS